MLPVSYNLHISYKTGIKYIRIIGACWINKNKKKDEIAQKVNVKCSWLFMRYAKDFLYIIYFDIICKMNTMQIILICLLNLNTATNILYNFICVHVCLFRHICKMFNFTFYIIFSEHLQNVFFKYRLHICRKSVNTYFSVINLNNSWLHLKFIRLLKLEEIDILLRKGDLWKFNDKFKNFIEEWGYSANCISLEFSTISLSCRFILDSFMS